MRVKHHTGQPFIPLKNPSGWRQVSLGFWRAANDPTVYGEMKFNMSQWDTIVKRAQERNLKISPLHLMVKAVGKLFETFPHFNVIIRRGKIYQRTSIDIFIQVAIREGAGDLGGLTIERVNQKNVRQIVEEIRSRSEKIRSHNDPQLERAKANFRFIPGLLMAFVVRSTDILMNDFGFDLSFLGVKPNAFGGCMVTNIGSFGLTHGYAPLVPPSRTPIIICLGAMREEPVVEDGKVVVRPMLTTTGTFDHRCFDGLQLSQITTFIKEKIENPSWLLEAP